VEEISWTTILFCPHRLSDGPSVAWRLEEAMKFQMTGKIVDAEPRLSVRMTKKRLTLGLGKREYMVIDSGFTGSIAIPEEWGERLDLSYAGIQSFALANGQAVEFPTYLGVVRIGDAEALFEFIVVGEPLLGMEFFERLGARLVIDCATGKVLVEGEIV
jgi:predicted aspartyl protease